MLLWRLAAGGESPASGRSLRDCPWVTQECGACPSAPPGWMRARFLCGRLSRPALALGSQSQRFFPPLTPTFDLDKDRVWRVGAGWLLPFCLIDPHEDILPMLRTGSRAAGRRARREAASKVRVNGWSFHGQNPSTTSWLWGLKQVTQLFCASLTL